MLFEVHAEIFARSLSRRLVAISLHPLFRPLHRRRTRRREKQTGNEAANDRAVKTLVACEIVQDRPDGRSSHRELNRTFAQSLLEFVKIDIEPRARIANDDNRFGLNAAT